MECDALYCFQKPFMKKTSGVVCSSFRGRHCHGLIHGKTVENLGEELTIVQKSGEARVDGRVLGVQLIQDNLVKQLSVPTKDFEGRWPS